MSQASARPEQSTSNEIASLASLGALPVTGNGQAIVKTGPSTFVNAALYTAGSGITITDGVIAATGTTYTAGSGISISGGVISATGSGSGTVTSVSVVTANGVSGTVATATTIPAITITLGAITPTSVVASGNVTGANLSGTNTGDNTVATALTGTPSITVATVTTTGNLELGNATDTTVSRSSAGVIAVEGVVVPSVSSTNTLTNKRVTKRVTALSANSATPTINTDNCDVVHITSQTTAITSFTTNLSGTPVDGDTLIISVTGTGAVGLTFGTSFEASTVALPTTTVSTTRLDIGFKWNTETSKWRCVAVA